MARDSSADRFLVGVTQDISALKVLPGMKRLCLGDTVRLDDANHIVETRDT